LSLKDFLEAFFSVPAMDASLPATFILFPSMITRS
jgi:hypothetical protein